MGELNALGCKVALDDFGTGYGGFTFLKRLPVSYLKIDVEFVGDLVENPASRHVVAAIVSLARGFGQQTVAEGVEDEPTLELLREMGVDYAQGYAIARPGPVEEVLKIAAQDDQEAKESNHEDRRGPAGWRPTREARRSRSGTAAGRSRTGARLPRPSDRRPLASCAGRPTGLDRPRGHLARSSARDDLASPSSAARSVSTAASKPLTSTRMASTVHRLRGTNGSEHSTTSTRNSTLRSRQLAAHRTSCTWPSPPEPMPPSNAPVPPVPEQKTCCAAPRKPSCGQPLLATARTHWPTRAATDQNCNRC